MPLDNDEEEPIFLASDADAGRRLDVFLAEKMPEVSRSQLQRFIETQTARVNGAPVKASFRLRAGDRVLVDTPGPPVTSAITPEAIALDVVFEDRDLLVVNKAKGMVVHPAPGAENGTLVNALLARCDDLSGIGGVERPGIVHRLDKDTTGLLVVAKNDAAHNDLQRQIQKKTAARKYLALVWGRPGFTNAVVDVPIGRHPTDRKRMAALEPGPGQAARQAVTELLVRELIGPFTLLECALQTGRTHQIRVHCAFAGLPVVGDPVYGGLRKVGSERVPSAAAQTQLNDAVAALHGQALHAYHLAFDHPRTGERLTFETSPPAEMTGLIERIRSLIQTGAVTP